MTQWEYHLWCEGAEWIGWCPNVGLFVTGPSETQTYQELLNGSRKKFLELQKESPVNGIEYKSNHSLACLQA